jgi:CBS domain-containing protein
MAQKVRELMAEPVSVPTDTTLVEAARMMRDAALGDLIIVDGRELRGMLTDRDIVIRALAQERSPADTKVADIASADLITVTPDDDLDTAILLMRAHAIRRLPVIEDGRNLVGLISLGDAALDRDEKSALADIIAAEPNT